jgi:dTDP-4-amino-4,6-dideoxygalactose transaminase
MATGRRLPRRVGLLGGTTTWADCLVAAYYLANPRHLVQGAAIAEFEAAFARQVGVRHAYSFAAGRVGLYGVLLALGIGPGDDVLVQVPTHIVVANAIRYTGARPVYVDCELNTYNIDLEQAERAITPRTKALVLQHTFGVPADIDGAVALARRHGLEIVEDCVHALGATYDGKQVGSFGRAAFFSTEETKTISTTMGGMVVTDDPDLAAQVAAYQARCAWPSASLTARRMLKLALYHVLTEPHLHYFTRAAYELLGERHPLPRPTTDEELRGLRPANYEERLSNAQAALGLRQLRRLRANLGHRDATASAYRARLAERGFAVPQLPAKVQPSFVRYPVWVDNRAAAVRLTAPYAVLGTWFTSVLEEAVSPTVADYELGSCPRAEAAAQHLVNLPTHPRVKRQDVEALTDALAEAS